MFKRKKFRIFDKEMRDALFGVGTVGMHLVGSTFIGLAMGFYLDKWLDPKYGTKPFLTLGFLLIGIIAGFRNVFFEAKRLQRMAEENAVPPPGSQKPEGKEKPYGYTPEKGSAEDAETEDEK